MERGVSIRRYNEIVKPQRTSHTQREGMVIQELQESFPGFAGVSAWTAVTDDPPDLIGVFLNEKVGMELVEWLDGNQMGAAQAREKYRQTLLELFTEGWNTAYQPLNLSSAVVCPMWSIMIAKSDLPGLRAEFWLFMQEVDRTWLTNPERVGSDLLADYTAYPLLSKYVETIHLRSGKQSWKEHGFCWIDIENDGGSFDPSNVIRTLEQAIDKKIDRYSNSTSDAFIKAKKLDRLELLIHGGFNLYAYNTPRGHMSLSEIAAAGAVYYAGLPDALRLFDRVWIFNSLNPACDLNEMVGFQREEGRLRWLAELWPRYSIDSRSFGATVKRLGGQ
jgi:hypothetical protein